MTSSFLSQNFSSKTSSYESSNSIEFTCSKSRNSPNNNQENSQQSDQYNEYVERKRKETQNSQIEQKNFLQAFRNILFGLFVIFLFYVAGSFITQKIDTLNTTIQTSTQAPPFRPKATSLSSLCNQHLPYLLSSQKEFENSYHSWYGKIGPNINGMSYDVGHFIERHLAVDGQCTYLQQAAGKTVFYDWSEVIKAFKKTSFQKCSVSDYNTYSYGFEIRIASPSQYIKGIDCKTGSIKKFHKIFILYRKAVQKPNPYQNQYLASNFVTIWTFYPKN